MNILFQSISMTGNLCNYCQGYHNQIIRGNSCIYFFCFIFHAHELDFPWNYAALHCSFLGRNIEKPFLSLQRVSCYRKRGKKLLTVNKVFAKHIFWFLLKPCKDIHHYCIEYHRSIWYNLKIRRPKNNLFGHI